VLGGLEDVQILQHRPRVDWYELYENIRLLAMARGFDRDLHSLWDMYGERGGRGREIGISKLLYVLRLWFSMVLAGLG